MTVFSQYYPKNNIALDDMADFYQYYPKTNIAYDMVVILFINTALKQIHDIPALYQYWSKKSKVFNYVFYLSVRGNYSRFSLVFRFMNFLKQMIFKPFCCYFLYFKNLPFP